MKREELLELQTALIRCLTDPIALREFRSGAAGWESLSFLDPELMGLMSAFYQSKRLDKVAKVLPLTFVYLASEMAELTPEFMKRHPPLNADSYTHGCQFYSLLRRRWRTHPPRPPFLPDLAYCELARVGVERRRPAGGPALLTGAEPPAAIIIRRRRGVRLHLCQYDIQPLFDPHAGGGGDVVHRRVCLVLSRPLASLSGKMLRVEEELFSLLKGLCNWTKVGFASDPRHSEQNFALLQRLEELGFLEVQLCESG